MAFPVGWSKQKIKIDITDLSLSADVTDYPYLLTEDAFKDRVFSLSDDGGGDLRFSSDAAGNTRLPCEIVTWNTSTKKAEIWVKIPTVVHDAPFYIYVWYDNTGETQPARDEAYGSDSVWTGYEAVYHKPTVYTCDFEQAADLDDWDLTNGAARTTDQHHTGSYSLQLLYNASYQKAEYVLPETTKRLYVSLYFRANTLCAGKAHIFHSPSFAVVLVNGHLQYYDGEYKNFPTDKTFGADQWYHLEVLLDATQNGGQYTVWLDGASAGTVTTLSFSSLDRYKGWGTNNSGQDIWIDDLYMAYVKDSTGNQRDGSAKNVGITSVPGKIGNAIDFDSAYVDTGSLFGAGTGDLCVSSWISMDSVAAASEHVIGNYSGTSNNGKYWILLKGSGGTFIFRVDDAVAAKDADYALTNFSADTPYFIQGIRDAGTGIYLNVNGVQRGTNTDAGGDITSSVNTRFGVQANSEATNFFAGWADETRITFTIPTADWTKLDYNTQNSPSSYLEALEPFVPRTIFIT